VGTVTSIATTGPITGGTITGTGTIGITQASSSSNGFLSSTDWNTFNGKQNALTNPVTGVGSINVIPKFTGSSTIGNSAISDNTNEVNISKRLVVSSGGQNIILTPNLGGTSNRIESGAFPLEIFTSSAAITLKAGSGSPEFTLAPTGVVTLSNLSGTGTRMVVASSTGVLSTQAITVGTVTSVAALTIGTTGTDLSSTVANSTTTPVITLNVPTASATNRGALSAADWTTFNNKQNVLTNPVTGTGAAGQVAFWNGTSSQTGDNGLFWDNTNKRLGVGTNAAAFPVDIISANNVLLRVSNTNGATLSSRIRLDAGTAVGQIIQNGQSSGNANLLQIVSAGNIALLASAGQEIFRIFGATGNVVIQNGGTFTDAGFRLDVNGTARVQGALTGSTSTFTNNALSALSIPLTLRNQGGGGNESVGIVFSAQNQQSNSIISSLREGATLGETLRFHTGINNVSTVKWSILSTGQLQSNGAQTIQTSTGALTLQPSNNVLVGTTTDVASSKLTIESTTQGFLPPRMTAAQRTAIASPVEGLIVYQTDSVIGLYIYANATWRTLGMI
jgi:hypothetical protein